jgi:hypothetical protein
MPLKKGLLVLLVLWACGAPEGAREGGFATEGQSAVGGNKPGGSGGAGIPFVIGGTGGMAATVGTGGGPAAMGGMIGTGGSTGSGGVTSTGGTPGTGGKAASGGSPGTGGAMSMGGAPGAGGKPATGGAPGTGGMSATGGMQPATGGTSGKPNLVMNPGFESGQANWDRLGGSGAIASPGRTGNNRLDEPNGYPWWQQGISGFITGRTYRLSAWGKCVTAGGLLGMKVALTSGGDERKETTPFTSAWTEQSMTMTISNDAAWVQVYISGPGENCSYDDISLVEQ